MHCTKLRMRNSPNAPEIEMPERAYQWRKVSVNNVNVYVPWTTLVEVLKSASRKLTFGQAKNNCDADCARDVEGETDDGDGDTGGTTSGSSIDSAQVNKALLAVGSQHRRQCQISRCRDLPVSFRPPTTQSVRTESLDLDGDTEESKSKL